MNSKSNSIDLSIVIPALNEEARIGKTLRDLGHFLNTDETMKKTTTEVIVVSANGTDKTHEIAAKHGKKLPLFTLLLPGTRVGKGRDVQFGMLRAKGEYVVYMDADLATPLHHLPEFYKMARQGNEVVVATRNLKKHHSHISRRLLSIAGNMAFRLLGGVWTEDSQCGFKMFSYEAVQICFSRQTIMKWGFDMELLTIARVNRLKVKYIRINDWKDQPGGTFEAGKMTVHAADSLQELVIIAKNRLLGRYS